jgi:flavin reductase (DIM6/NTAB) family NADH-FMN oxidoreductase RutF
MTRVLCDPADARRILNPGPVAIVTTSWRAMPNAAPIAWTTTLSMNPPVVGVVVHPHRHTADMIRFGEEFAINIPSPALLKQTAYLGTLTGLGVDKLQNAKLQTFKGVRIDPPLIEGCLAWIECGLQDVIPIGDHTLFVGKVVTVQALDEAYATRWLLPSPELSPVAYLGGKTYATIADARDIEFEVDELGGLVAESPEEREEREETEARRIEALAADPENIVLLG